MLKIAVIIKGQQEEFLAGCANEGKSYSWVLRKALQEYMDRLVNPIPAKPVKESYSKGRESNLGGETL